MTLTINDSPFIPTTPGYLSVELTVFAEPGTEEDLRLGRALLGVTKRIIVEQSRDQWLWRGPMIVVNMIPIVGSDGHQYNQYNLKFAP